MKFNYINTEHKQLITNVAIIDLKTKLLKDYLEDNNIKNFDVSAYDDNLNKEIVNFIENDSDCELRFEDFEPIQKVETFSQTQKDLIVNTLKELSIKIIKQELKDIDLNKTSQSDFEAHTEFLNINLADLISELAYSFDIETKDLINAK